ncbi:MAG: hypothetical protein NZ908_03065 [Candidatus Micrarchaeota archaeon]|nr:hypothetical protein [Candidatus Micrarchaeota archaeon]MCX8154771.1 hypothetical protein [Candidatus Micrarchaeota archaeon]
MELLAKLSEAISPSGREDRVREILREEFLSAGLNVREDDSGNILAYTEIVDRPIVVSAHMDEIGFIVRYIDEDGFIRIVPLGGYLPEYLLSKRVVIFGKEEVQGIVQRDFVEDWKDEEERKVKFKKLYIQTDMDRKEVQERIRPGNVGGVYMESKIGSKYVVGKALDDRIGVYLLTRLARDLPKNVILMGSTEEEVSSIGKGAYNAVWNLNPRVFIALDVGEANDYPGGEKFTKLGGGPEITVREIRGIGNVIRDRYLEMIDQIAKEHSIPIQYRITTDSATEASNVFNVRGGIPSIAICNPIRYIHTFNEFAMIDDINNTYTLVRSLINRLI